MMMQPEEPLRSESFTGVVLAGGRSSRFGSDKALAMLEGRPLLHRVLDVLHPLMPRLCVVVDHVERYQALLESLPYPVDVLVDQLPQRGPLGGVYSAMVSAPSPWLLVTSCDAPLLEPALIRLLMQRADEASGLVKAPGGARAVVARVEGRLHPFPGAYSILSAPHLLQALQKNALKMVDLLAEIQVDCLLPDDISAGGGTSCSFLNVNTPAELSDVQQQLQGMRAK